MLIKVNNGFKVGQPFVKIGGDWKMVAAIFTKVNGVWKLDRKS